MAKKLHFSYSEFYISFIHKSYVFPTLASSARLYNLKII